MCVTKQPKLWSLLDHQNFDQENIAPISDWKGKHLISIKPKYDLNKANLKFKKNKQTKK